MKIDIFNVNMRPGLFYTKRMHVSSSLRCMYKFSISKYLMQDTVIGRYCMNQIFDATLQAYLKKKSSR